jgi:beta-galactosidase/beta-glucuronidase
MPHVDLATGWTIAGAQGARQIVPPLPAAVPGSVYLDLLRAGVIEDPRRGMGLLTSRWVETCEWTYQLEFTCPPEAFAPGIRRAWFLLDVVDGGMTVELNGQAVGGHNRIDVTGLLREGANRLSVRIHMCHAAAHFARIGLAGAVRLEWTHLPVRVDAPAVVATQDDDLSTGHVRVRQHVEVLTDHPVRVSLLAQLPEAGALAEVNADLPPGPGVIEAMVDVRSAKPWHPADHGPQNLYTLMITVVANGHDVARHTAAVGFRQVAIEDASQALARVSAEPSGGAVVPSFPFVRVNGQRLFCKAASVVQPDLLEPGDVERWKELLAAAAELHLNALVLLPEVTPPPECHQLADRAGILLFQRAAEPGGHPSAIAIGPMESFAIPSGPAPQASVRDCLGDAQGASAEVARALHDCTGNESPAVEDLIARGEALSAAIESVRRRGPAAGGIHLHRLNDSMPATRTRALVDHAMRRMPAWYYARRALSPIHVSIAVEGDQVVVFGHNDTAKLALGDLRFGVVQLDGMYVINRSVRVQFAAHACTRLVTFPLARWRDRHTTIAFAVFSRMNRTLARNCLAITPPEQMRWPRAAVQTQLIAQQVTFTSPTFARGVCLDETGEQALTDNYFDLYPGIAHTITWTLPHVPRIVHVANA